MKYKLAAIRIPITALGSKLWITEIIKLSGPVFGTSYNIQYYDQKSRDFTKDIDSLFKEINNSMSNYQENSKISKLNRNENYSLDNYFITVFNASKKIYRETEGVLSG